MPDNPNQPSGAAPDGTFNAPLPFPDDPRQRIAWQILHGFGGPQTQLAGPAGPTQVQTPQGQPVPMAPGPTAAAAQPAPTAAPTPPPDVTPAPEGPATAGPASQPLIGPEVLKLLQAQLAPDQGYGAGLALAGIAMSNPQLAAQLLQGDEAGRQNALNQLTNLAAQEGATRRAEIQQEGYIKRAETAADQRAKLEERKAQDRQRLEIVKQAASNPYMGDISKYGLFGSNPDWDSFLKAYGKAQKQEQDADLATKWSQSHRPNEDPGDLPLLLHRTEEDVEADPVIGPIYRRAKGTFERIQADEHATKMVTIGRNQALIDKQRQAQKMIDGGLDKLSPKELTSYITSSRGHILNYQKQITDQQKLVDQYRAIVGSFREDPTSGDYRSYLKAYNDSVATLHSLESTFQTFQDSVRTAEGILRKRNNDNPASPEQVDPAQLSDMLEGVFPTVVGEVANDPNFRPLIDAIPDKLIRGSSETIADPADTFLRIVLAGSTSDNPAVKSLADIAINQMASGILARVRASEAFQGAPTPLIYKALQSIVREYAVRNAETAKANGMDTSWWKYGQQLAPWAGNPVGSIPPLGQAATPNAQPSPTPAAPAATPPPTGGQ